MSEIISVDEREVETCRRGLLGRYPRGRAFSGKVLQALERGFAEEFALLRKTALQSLGAYLDFWRRLEQQKYGTLAGVELAAREVWAQTYIFYSTGQRAYQAARARSNTYFGGGSFGGRVDRFGDIRVVRPSAKAYKYGYDSMGNYYIDYLLDSAESAERARAVMEAVSAYDRNANRFFYYVGGSSSYLTPLMITADGLIGLKRRLLEVVPMGMFGIICYRII